MENEMILHKDKKTFAQAIRITGDYFGIRDVFIEKDYWATYILKKLSQADFKDKVVFKGGTSLSKAYDLINRFSEDVDLAILDSNKYTGNAIRELIREVEETLTSDLKEIEIRGITTKHSRIRRTAYNYENVLGRKEDAGYFDKIILEINSFANPLPYEERSIECMIAKYFFDKGFLYSREKYGIRSFKVNTLAPSQTLIEKLVSIIRFSYSNKNEDGLDKKIRHFHDLYYLCESSYCKDFIETDKFLKAFRSMYNEDLKKFDVPTGWKGSKLEESPLLTDFPRVWAQLKPVYEVELSKLVFGSLVPSELIYQKNKYLLNKISRN